MNFCGIAVEMPVSSCLDRHVVPNWNISVAWKLIQTLKIQIEWIKKHKHASVSFHTHIWTLYVFKPYMFECVSPVKNQKWYWYSLLKISIGWKIFLFTSSPARRPFSPAWRELRDMGIKNNKTCLFSNSLKLLVQLLFFKGSAALEGKQR